MSREMRNIVIWNLPITKNNNENRNLQNRATYAFKVCTSNSIKLLVKARQNKYNRSITFRADHESYMLEYA